MKTLLKHSLVCLLALTLSLTMVLPIFEGDQSYTPNYIFDEVEDN